MSLHNTHSGMAALSICEALLLALHEAKVLPESEILGILEDAAGAHENTGDSEPERDMHSAAAKLIKDILASGQTLRR